MRGGEAMLNIVLKKTIKIFVINARFRIRIGSDPHHFAGSGSVDRYRFQANEKVGLPKS
jgi:hypothetical protein